MAKLTLIIFIGAIFCVTNVVGKNSEPSDRNGLIHSYIHFKNQPVFQPGQPTLHTVAVKETLFSISKKYGVTVDDIKRWNNLKNNSISVGQSLTIRKGVPDAAQANTGGTSRTTTLSASERPGPPPHKSLQTKHTVMPKETLFSISKKYGVTVTDLKEWNDIGPEGLQAGSSIWIMAPVNASSTSQAAPDKTVFLDQPVSRIKEVKETADKEGKDKAGKPKTDTPVVNTVDDSNEMKESGDIALMEGADKSKYLCWHKEAPIGSILKVKNLANGKEVFVRVQGHLEMSDRQYILRVSSLAAQRLGESAASFKADVTYYK